MPQYCAFEGLEQLLKDSEDDALRRQVRGVLGAVGAMKDPTLTGLNTTSQPRAAAAPGKTLLHTPTHY